MSNKDELLTAWGSAVKALKDATATERALRTQIIEAFSENVDDMRSGVENIDVGYGFDLKITHKLTYTLDKADDYAKVDNVSDVIETLLGDADFADTVINRLFKRKFDISVSEYNKLGELPNGDKIKAAVDAILTIKPASKSVELKKRAVV